MFVIASEAKQSQTVYGIASSLTLLAMTVELLNDLKEKTPRAGGKSELLSMYGLLLGYAYTVKNAVL